MEIIIVQDAEEGASIVADAIEELVAAKPDAVLGLATGMSPTATYDELQRRYRDRRIDFSQVTAFMLDEYLDLLPDDGDLYRNVINYYFIRHINLPLSQLHSPNSRPVDVLQECARYEQAIREAGPIDLQLLGIGTAGHIGFNEATSSFGSRTRIKTLTDQTRRDNGIFFGDDVPIHVITQGIGTILEARHVVLLANTENKADAIRDMVEGPLTAMVPASALQLHPHATVIVTEEAAQRLRHADYYRFIRRNKPRWQPL